MPIFAWLPQKRCFALERPGQQCVLAKAAAKQPFAVLCYACRSSVLLLDRQLRNPSPASPGPSSLFASEQPTMLTEEQISKFDQDGERGSVVAVLLGANVPSPHCRRLVLTTCFCPPPVSATRLPGVGELCQSQGDCRAEGTWRGAGKFECMWRGGLAVLLPSPRPVDPPTELHPHATTHPPLR